MDDRHRLTRRSFTMLGTAAFLAPITAAAQPAPGAGDFIGFADFAARCRELSGFDPLPRTLLTRLANRMPEGDRRAVAQRDPIPEPLRKRVLKALYTGVYEPGDGEDGESVRIGYPDALMYAAVDDSINVPTYCGGLPGYWEQKPVLS
ncbi:MULTISPECIES: sugar dehydrogenase complex small subunit [unclassified Roseitalea]|uniref:sugar dehydrogenase complex small subunit n=1 Tax=unclassified Roseitalea TaxID=2639107 RepID=UPI00273FAA01|nr:MULTISPECIES: sugar dehydrogenase complex small subunit [unclassified Roseitalea]